jgi:hypothetical protein
MKRVGHDQVRRLTEIFDLLHARLSKRDGVVNDQPAVGALGDGHAPLVAAGHLARYAPQVL